MSPQIVLVTGSSSGIGLATAARLALDAQKRFVVIATVTSLTRKADLEAAVGDALEKTVFIRELDITKDDEITSVVDDVITAYGRIDILLNNAGVISADDPEPLSRKVLDKIFGVNLIGTIRLTQTVLPHMKRVRTGRIITQSSVAGKLAFPYFGLYTASKFGLEGYFEAIAAEVKAYNIRVCLVEAGSIKTRMIDNLPNHAQQRLNDFPDDAVHDIDRQQLSYYTDPDVFKPFMKVEDFAELLVTRFICAEEPPLRQLVCGDAFKEVIGQAAAALSGETALSVQTFGKGL